MPSPEYPEPIFGWCTRWILPHDHQPDQTNLKVILVLTKLTSRLEWSEPWIATLHPSF
jgi:hypothetical protein